MLNVINNICQTCIEELETAHTFKLKCDQLNYECRKTPSLCEICGITFKNLEILEQHRGKCHTKKSETLKRKSDIGGGDSLKFRISTKKGMVTKIKRSEKNDNAVKDVKMKSNQFVCPHCEFKFLTAGGLNSHMMWHNDRKKQHKCSECKLMFLNDVDLRKHEKYEHQC